MSELYETILSLCNSRNITGYKLCNDIHISKSTLTDLKMGRKKSLNAKTAAKIAEYFNVTVEYLLGSKNDSLKIYDENDNIVVLDDETRDFIDQLRKRPEQRLLFSVSKKATKDDIIKAVKIIEALEDNEEGE